LNGLEKEDQPGYSTHVITKNAVDFIKRSAQKDPFFLLVTHEAVHLPFQTPADTVENRKPIPKDQFWSRDRIRPKYKVMLEEMDKGVGEILDAVEQTGIADNTLIVFFSDNGAIGAGSNQPFRGGKFSHYEGGHRVPAIAVWPGNIKPGTKTDQLVMASDLLPTFAQLADAEIPPTRKLDGVSVVGVLQNGESLQPRQVFFGYEPKLGTAMRDGPWKMIVKQERLELYNLADDIGERTNLAEQLPKRATEMHQAITEWKAKVTWQKEAK
ncbi:MAG: arylsulfatase A, partial [Pirellulaceae bacterium]